MILKANNPIKIQGFIATTAVVLISLGIFTFSIVMTDSVYWYVDAVSSRERRIQLSLDRIACMDTGYLIRAKDVLLDIPVYVADFDCTVEP